MSKWDQYPEARLEYHPGGRWISLSLQLNGVQWGTPECDDLIQEIVDKQEEGGWELAAIVISKGKYKANFLFINSKVYKLTILLRNKGVVTEKEIETAFRNLYGNKLQEISIECEEVDAQSMQ